MVLGSSRDASVEYADWQDLGTFWACHHHAFTVFGGVPDELRYERTKTVIKHSVGLCRERHPDAIALAGQDGLTIPLGWPCHPATKSTVEKPVDTIREWCFRSRAWTELADLNEPWQAWPLEVWRPHVNRTTGTAMHARLCEVQDALRPLLPSPYNVCESTTRQVANACRFSFEGSLCSVPTEVARQRIALRIFPDHLKRNMLEPIPRYLGEYSRVRHRGRLVEEPTQAFP
jgi:hypothetical protein